MTTEEPLETASDPVAELNPPNAQNGPVTDLRRWIASAPPVVLPIAMGIGGALVILAVRYWQTSDRVPGWWNDTNAYDLIADRPLFSGRFWMGDRAPGVPLFLKLFGEDPSYKFMAVNIGAACVAWGWLCGELIHSLRAEGLRACGIAGAVLGLSLTSSVILWDSQVLSESLSISLAVALVAGVIRVERVRSVMSVAILLAVAWAWTWMRDSHAITVLVFAAAGYLWFRRSAPPLLPRRIATVGVVGLVIVAGWSMTSAWVGHRDLLPLHDVFAVRVLPYPDRVAWFAEHGMPQEDELNEAAPDPDPEREDAPVLGLGRDDERWAGWWDWLESDGKEAWMRYVIEHPWYVFTEPLENPERTYNNAEGTLLGYAGDMRHVSFVNEIFWAPTTLLVVAVAALALAHAGNRRRPAPLTVIGWVLLVAAAISGLVTWHTGGMETARHLLLSAFELRLGVVLLVLGLLIRPGRADDEATDRQGEAAAVEG